MAFFEIPSPQNSPFRNLNVQEHQRPLGVGILLGTLLSLLADLGLDPWEDPWEILGYFLGYH